MLNELYVLKRGAEQAGIRLAVRHPDIKDSTNIPTFVVSIDSGGDVTGIRLKPEEVTPWTLRDGMHNSFPFVQVKPPLRRHSYDPEDEFIDQLLDRRTRNRGEVFGKWLNRSAWNLDSVDDWPGDGLLDRIAERLTDSRSLVGKPAGIVPETIERFLSTCTKKSGGPRLLKRVASAVIDESKKTPDALFVEAAIGFLLGKFNKKQNEWENQTGLLFEATGYNKPIFHADILATLSECLNENEQTNLGAKKVACGLTGEIVPTVDDKFPQPNLPVLGQTYLFARNSAAKANTRYGRSSIETMPVGVDTANLLSAAIMALTNDSLQDVTWRRIPGEAPKQTDLLVAYVEASADASVVDVMVGNEDFEEDEEEATDETQQSVGIFEAKTKRLFESLRGRVDGDVCELRVNFFVFRKVDPANRKVVYSLSRTIGRIYQAALAWADGERNLPAHLSLLARFGSARPAQRRPPHVAPLGLIAFSKRVFRRGGAESQEVSGLPASEAMQLFLSGDGDARYASQQSLERFLRLVLRRREELCSNAAHLLRKNRLDMVNQNREALRTATVLGVLLDKLARRKEQYMSEAAFKLGQLLAAADVVHAGYCIDQRSGSIPPSLLGNQIFKMAQSSPATALGVLCRRWKPYDGWARKLQHTPTERARIDAMRNSKTKSESQNGWDIIKALRNWRDMKPVAESLTVSLSDCKVDDVFRAELLLGYMAGLPPSQKASDE